MKIGFFGNVNNYPFMLARTLRSMGQEILFVVESSQRLDRPEFRYGDVGWPYPAWIVDVSPFEEKNCVLPTLKRSLAVGHLRRCDAVVLNGFGPALLHLVRKPAIIILTGSDLDYYGDFSSVEVRTAGVTNPPVFLKRIVERQLSRRLIALQRRGIPSACAVNYFPPGMVDRGDALLAEIGLEPSKRVFFMMSDTDNIPLLPPPENPVDRVFCATRLTWKMPVARGCSQLDYKGSDIMIHGLALFLKRHGQPLEIRLVKKGRHVAETMRLAEDLGITPHVTWLEEMSQSAVLEEFGKANIVMEQFGQSMVGMAGLDAMAMGRPVIGNGRPEIVESIIGSASAICQARTPEEICRQLERLVGDRGAQERIGRESRRYIEDFFSCTHAARLCLERLSQAT